MEEEVSPELRQKVMFIPPIILHLREFILEPLKVY